MSPPPCPACSAPRRTTFAGTVGYSPPVPAVPAANSVSAVVALAPALAEARPALPRRRTARNERPLRERVGPLLATAGVIVAVLLVVPWAAPAAAGAVVLVALPLATVVGAVALMVAAPRDGEGRLAPLLLAALLATGLVAGWLTGDGVRRVLLVFPWLGVALLLRWGVGTRTPRALLWWPALLTLAAGLLWLVLLLTIDQQPSTHVPARWSQWNVFAGWPWPHYLGAVRGNAPFAERDPSALAANYALMLGVAAVVLWRRPQAWLVRWAPRLAAALALLYLVGGYRLALATDG
jgi:hypothetical protein